MARSKPSGGAASPPAPAALTEDWRLACGRLCRFEMPDMLAFAAGDIDLPNVTQADIFSLLYGKDGPSITDVDIINGDRRRTRGLYALFALVAIDPDTGTPICCLDDEDRAPAQIGPRALTWGDVSGAYSFFRFGPTILPVAATDTGSESGADAALSGGGVPPGAE